MSLEATLATWKIAKKAITASEKLFLLSCARRANEEHECWPSIKRMTEDTGFDRKTIINIRQRLIEKSLLCYTGEMKGRAEQIPVMRLMYVQEEEMTIKTIDQSTKKSQSTRTEIGTGEKFTSTEIGTGTSTEIGTGTSTEIGTLNITYENLSINNNKTYVDFEKSTKVPPHYFQDEYFMKFYKIYPNKQKPKMAHQAFYKAAKKSGMDVPAFSDMIYNDIQARLKNNWLGRPKNKYPFPQRYLNESEWEGEIYAPEAVECKYKATVRGPADVSSYW